ncbi:ABC transporter ATP-binding protein [Actinomadura rubrisoli]|uniref:ABC transporter ATP-binding protein n=1 Tax=Actinomadura rubrisoli TaxID=2530368 RepID=A0A4R5C5A1_9ACTN|nr:ABC transporter ATP-binding protein [Actinomadura rubrisoli]TDD94828.1 ABC transporter ATP-binding protein [Actinomadura rubrisoli]
MFTLRNRTTVKESQVGEAVELVEVHKEYSTDAGVVKALAGVSAVFEAGTFTAVMGPSGSGKSTLLQCAAGLDTVTSGQVRVAGAELSGLSSNALTILRRDRIGFVFQAFNLIPSLTARQNIELPRRLAGRPAPPGDVDAVLESVGLTDRAGHRPSELSGGQQQRVAIARALVTRPDVVFADEPTGALDSASSREVLKLVRGLVDGPGLTVVMVTHDPRAASHADRVLFLADGRISGELADPTADLVAAQLAAMEAGA